MNLWNDWSNQRRNLGEQSWYRIANPQNFSDAPLSDDGTPLIDVEIVDEQSEQVFGELAVMSEFEANVAEAYEEIGLPEGDPTFDSIVNEMLGDLPQ